MESVMLLSLVSNMVINSVPAVLVEGKITPTMEKIPAFSFFSFFFLQASSDLKMVSSWWECEEVEMRII